MRTYLAFFFAFVVSGVGASEPEMGLNDHIEVIDGLIQEMQGRYRLHVVEAFEETPYRSRAASTDLDDIHYIYNRPEPNDSFVLEENIVKKHTGLMPANRKTLSVQTAFSVPGRQVYFFQPLTSVKIPGQPMKGSIWVKSQGYLHRLILIVQNSSQKKIEIDLGTLSWHGWQRLDFSFPKSVYAKGPSMENPYGAKLVGFKIVSSKFDSSYQTTIELDQFLVVSDYTSQMYPGAEIKDNWD